MTEIQINIKNKVQSLVDDKVYFSNGYAIIGITEGIGQKIIKQFWKMYKTAIRQLELHREPKDVGI